MNKRKKILIIHFADLAQAPRTHNQILFLKDKYDVNTAAFQRSSIEGIINFKIDRPENKLISEKIPFALSMKLFSSEKSYFQLPLVKNGLRTLMNIYDMNYDLIIAHDPITLPLALTLAEKWNSKVLLDAHEYTPRQYEHNYSQRFFFNPFWHSICKKYLLRADAMTTVGDGIADEYKRHFKVNCDVITNAPFFQKLSPHQIDSSIIRMIHHGRAHPSRRTEEMIRLMSLLDDRFHLDLILINRGTKYYETIVELSRNTPRISLRDPVPMTSIADSLNKYDIGLYLLFPTSFNTKMAVPNKLFEFIQARLALAIWPSPEMKKIVKQYDCGIVSDDYSLESMAKMLNSLTDQDIMNYKSNAHAAASILCAENNRDKLLSIVEKLIGK